MRSSVVYGTGCPACKRVLRCCLGAFKLGIQAKRLHDRHWSLIKSDAASTSPQHHTTPKYVIIYILNWKPHLHPIFFDRAWWSARVIPVCWAADLVPQVQVWSNSMEQELLIMNSAGELLYEVSTKTVMEKMWDTADAIVLQSCGRRPL